MAYPQTIWDNVQQKNLATKIFWVMEFSYMREKAMTMKYEIDGMYALNMGEEMTVKTYKDLARMLKIDPNYCKHLWSKYYIYHHEPSDRKEILYRTRLVYEKKL